MSEKLIYIYTGYTNTDLNERKLLNKTKREYWLMTEQKTRLILHEQWTTSTLPARLIKNAVTITYK